MFTFDSRRLPFVSMTASSDRNLSTIRERLAYALELEGREGNPLSQNAIEAELMRRGLIGKNRGYLSSLLSGRRGTQTMNVDVLGALADILHVRFEWLALGVGSVRRDGRIEATPAEQAIRFARENNCREDAIEGAWQHHRPREREMTVYDWITAIHAEAQLLNTRGVPRPEKIAEKHDKMQRLQKKKRRAGKAPPVETTETPDAAARRRASG